MISKIIVFTTLAVNTPTIAKPNDEFKMLNKGPIINPWAKA
ncbi:hypothetical protein [Mesoplasma florum]|nr:hypothetical protein [Mesoplasma florum]